MQNKFTPLQFIKLFEEFNIKIRNPNHNGFQLNTGITNAGKFYSVEVLFEMLISISGTYGRLAYKQDQSGNDDALSTVFKKLSMGFLDLANTSYHIANAENIIKFTELAGRNIALLKEFENEYDRNNLLALQEKYQLSPLENENIFKDYILPRVDRLDVRPMLNPQADLLGGQPGSGKSSLMHMVIKGGQNENIAMPIASDDYRHFHPQYQKLLNDQPELAPMIVTPDADIWTDKMLNECMARRLNIAIEGTMGKASWAVGKENRLKQNGYDIRYRIMAVKPDLSKISTFNRYAEMLRGGIYPRFVTASAHDERFEGLKQTVDMLSKQSGVKLCLYTREIKSDAKGAIIDSLKILKSNPLNPSLDFKNQTTASLTSTELDYVKKSVEFLQHSGISKSLLSEAFPKFINDNSRKLKW